MAVYTAIDDPEAYFQTVIYTGNGSTQSITLPGTTDLQPDMVWFKRRDDTDSNKLIDDVRGVTARLVTDSTAAEVSDDDVITSFNSDGFSLGDDDSSNASSATHVAWCWKESATAGFDMVSFTGNVTDERTVAHSLSAAPEFILVKNRADAVNWGALHMSMSSAPETDIMYLDRNDNASDDDGFWSDGAPTTSVFSVGVQEVTNGNSDAMIAYLWAPKQGFSKFGSYVGNNGGASGVFVYTGFRPALVIQKAASAGNGEWQMTDNERDPFNPSDSKLNADRNNAEFSDFAIDILSNGFKTKADGADQQDSGVTYVYIAFAEAPFVNSNGVPCNAR